MTVTTINILYLKKAEKSWKSVSNSSAWPAVIKKNIRNHDARALRRPFIFEILEKYKIRKPKRYF